MRDAAKALARSVYGDATLRPSIDETMARVLVGEASATDKNAERAEVAAVVASLSGVKDDRVRARLLYSLGRDLNAQMVLLVSAAAAGPTARVVRVAQKRFSSVTLVAKPGPGGEGWDWSDATVIARGLLTAPPPGPLSQPRGPNVEGEPDDGIEFYESPWFWTGVGLVVAAGTVVFILTQTGVDDAQTVNLKGTVAP